MKGVDQYGLKYTPVGLKCWYLGWYGEKKKNKKFAAITGTIVSDIGVIQSGKVATVFKVDSDIKNPMFINFISEYVIDHKFYFKLQKQQRYKVRYTITF